MVALYLSSAYSLSSCKCCAFFNFKPSPFRRPSFSKPPKIAIMAMSEDPVREWILTEGKATHITKMSPVGGGCINLATRYDTDAGPFFVKTNRSIGPGMFEAEALGLRLMYETNTIRVPKPFKVGSLPRGGSFIIMEFVEFGSSRSQAGLGRKLAEMHKAGKSEKGFGFEADNTIGSTPQINTWTSDWIEFYAEHRLGYQLKLARDQYGDLSIYEKGKRLTANLKPLFEDVVIEPSLLHGDLWSGNITYDKNGEPVILDPACYYGHCEAEFGMSWCAGFGPSFYNSYFEHYMLNSTINEQLVSVATVKDGDVVLEIGPGTGSLTNVLIQAGATVLAIEKDPHMAALVEERFADTGRLTVLGEDFTKCHIRSHMLSLLESKELSNAGTRDAKVVANIPFNISKDVVKQLLPMGDIFSEVVLLLQDEAAIRLVESSTRSSEYRPINIFVNFYSDPEYNFKVPRENFFPQPNVDAAVVTFNLKQPSNYPSVSSIKSFFSMVNSAFNGKRKMLRKTLQHIRTSSEIEAALTSVGLPVTSRPEELTLDDFVKLHDSITST